VSGHKKILITGASGFVGGHLTPILECSGATVVKLSHTGDSYDLTKGIALNCDLTNYLELHSLLREHQFDLVIHVAAKKTRGQALADYRTVFETNVIGLLNLVNVCNEKRNSRFILLGTADEYGIAERPYDETKKEFPISAYGASKLAATQMIQAMGKTHKFSYVVLRPSVIFGPQQKPEMFLPALILSLLRNEAFHMTSGLQMRDYIYIDDLVNAVLILAERPELPNEVINICRAESISIKNLALMVADMIGINKRSLLRFDARELRYDEIVDYRINNTKARKILCWAPETSLEQGLKKTIESFRETIARQ
jgi:UDP-glucose 4-epimerase